MAQILSLGEFKTAAGRHLCKGTWTLEYHDRTHLPRGAFVALASIEIEDGGPGGNWFFRFEPKSHTGLAKGFEAAEKLFSKGMEATKAAKVSLDQIRESLVRVGLLQPRFEIEGSHSLECSRFAIVILDTNALRSGSAYHLQEQFPDTRIWMVVPSVTLMEIGERLASVASRDRGGCKPQNSALLRTRPQVTIAPGEIMRIREQFPAETLELAPELLRVFRGYETRHGDKEPDRVSINDRLILESIKDLQRQRNVSSGVYLMSGDKDISRLAHLEGIQTIFPEVPDLETTGIYSVRYSLESRAHVVCSIFRLLWDLAHVFSCIRMSRDGAPGGESDLALSYYYESKLVKDWADDKLEVQVGPGCPSDAV